MATAAPLISNGYKSSVNRLAEGIPYLSLQHHSITVIDPNRYCFDYSLHERKVMHWVHALAGIRELDSIQTEFVLNSRGKAAFRELVLRDISPDCERIDRRRLSAQAGQAPSAPDAEAHACAVGSRMHRARRLGGRSGPSASRPASLALVLTDHWEL